MSMLIVTLRSGMMTPLLPVAALSQTAQKDNIMIVIQMIKEQCLARVVLTVKQMAHHQLQRLVEILMFVVDYVVVLEGKLVQDGVHPVV